jgi:hypothetical protein
MIPEGQAGQRQSVLAKILAGKHVDHHESTRIPKMAR